MRWPNGTVPYHISELYDPFDYSTIYKAIRILGFMTCVKFVPWDGKVEDYLLIWPVKYPAVIKNSNSYYKFMIQESTHTNIRKVFNKFE